MRKLQIAFAFAAAAATISLQSHAAVLMTVNGAETIVTSSHKYNPTEKTYNAMVNYRTAEGAADWYVSIYANDCAKGSGAMLWKNPFTGGIVQVQEFSLHAPADKWGLIPIQQRLGGAICGKTPADETSLTDPRLVEKINKAQAAEAAKAAAVAAKAAAVAEAANAASAKAAAAIAERERADAALEREREALSPVRIEQAKREAAERAAAEDRERQRVAAIEREERLNSVTINIPNGPAIIVHKVAVALDGSRSAVVDVDGKSTTFKVLSCRALIGDMVQISSSDGKVFGYANLNGPNGHDRIARELCSVAS